MCVCVLCAVSGEEHGAKTSSSTPSHSRSGSNLSGGACAIDLESAQARDGSDSGYTSNGYANGAHGAHGAGGMTRGASFQQQLQLIEHQAPPPSHPTPIPSSTALDSPSSIHTPNNIHVCCHYFTHNEFASAAFHTALLSCLRV